MAEMQHQDELTTLRSRGAPGCVVGEGGSEHPARPQVPQPGRTRAAFGLEGRQAPLNAVERTDLEAHGLPQRLDAGVKRPSIRQGIVGLGGGGGVVRHGAIPSARG